MTFNQCDVLNTDGQFTQEAEKFSCWLLYNLQA